MSLSTRLALAMAGLAFATAAAVGLLAWREIATHIPELTTPALAAGRSILIICVVAVGCASACAIALARSLSRPLVQMKAAVEGFARGAPMTFTPTAGGEIGVVARALLRMAEEIAEKTVALRRNAEIFDSIMSSMAEAVFLLDENARCVFANRAAIALLGDHADTGLQDWVNRYELYRPDGVSRVSLAESPFFRAVKGEQVDGLELAFCARGEETRARIVLSARPIRDANSAPKGAVFVLRDVTQAAEIERQLRQSQKMDAIGQLTGGIAHDFNNLLTVITGTIEILAEGVADRPKLAAIAEMINEAATRGADLTQQLLAFARRQPLQPHETDINGLLIDTARLLRPTLGEHIEIESMLHDDAWRIMVDRSQLSTAVINLALNARDAMPGGGKLVVETANVVLDEAYARANPEVVPGPYVMVAVSDSGSGIPAAIREKVFEPFFTTKGVGKGTGLGLSMVYGFVKQSGGHIKIDSEEGQGTTIKLYLPRVHQEAATSSGQEAAAIAQGGSETILVVEDDALVRGYVVAQLQSLGHRTLAAGSGVEALAIVDGGAEFDLLFTDVIMPGGMNGRQLAEEVAKRRPFVKVLYTSGYAENALLHHGRLDPGVVLLNKPYRKSELARKVREVLTAPRQAA
jgi:signal transduction histidine kinase